MSQPLFVMQNPGELPVPLFIQFIMYAVFSLPLIVIPITLREVPESPWLLLVYVAACFPLALMWGLKRLMGRYAVAVHEDGRLVVTLPFKSQTFAAGALQRVAFNTVRAQVGGTVQNRTWVQLIGAGDTLLTQFASTAFSGEQIQDLLQALRQVNPQLPIDRG